MSFAYYAGVVCGVLAVAVIVFILNKFQKKKGAADAEYDERQEALRGRAYRLAYKSLVIYLAAYIILEVQNVVWCDTGAGLFLGILFSAMVFIIYCIYKNAYFRVSDKPAFYAILFAVLGFVNIVCGLVVPRMKGMEQSRLLGAEDLNFVVGIFSLIIFVNILIKLHLDKKDEME